MSAGGTRSLAQTGDYGVQTDAYHAPEMHQGLTSYQSGFRTSFQKAGGAFTTNNVQQGHVTGLSAQNRSGVVNWDAGATPPGFQQNS